MVKAHFKTTIIPVIAGILILGFIGISQEADAAVVYNSADRKVTADAKAGTIDAPDESVESSLFTHFDETVAAAASEDVQASAAAAGQDSTLDQDQIAGNLASATASAVETGGGGTASGSASSSMSVDFDITVITNFKLTGTKSAAASANPEFAAATAASTITLFDVTNNQQVFSIIDTSFDESGILEPGNYVLTVTAVADTSAGAEPDQDGSAAASANVDFTLSLIADTPPDTQITKAVDGKNVTPKKGKTSNNSIQFTFTGTDDVGVASFECSLDGGTFVPCTSPQSYTLLPQGAHFFLVRAVDTVGNQDPIPAYYSWFITSKTK